MERRVGLTIKRRSHFTNIYAPFCPDCGRATESRKALQTHLAMTHGKRLVHYKLRPGAVAPHYVSRPLNIEGQELNGELLDEYLPDMKRIWRLSEVGHTDLILSSGLRGSLRKRRCCTPFAMRSSHAASKKQSQRHPHAC